MRGVLPAWTLLLAACGTRVTIPAAATAEHWLVLVEPGKQGERTLSTLSEQGWQTRSWTGVPGLARIYGSGEPRVPGIQGAWRDTNHPVDTGHPGTSRSLAGLGQNTADEVGRPSGIPWNLKLIRAPEAWRQGLLGRTAIVAVVDSGLDPGHPAFAGAVDWQRSHNLVQDEPFTDLNGHGTHVAGIIGARPDARGSTGVAPACTLRIVKVLDRRGYGHDHLVMEGVLLAAREGAEIINVSIGTRLPWGSSEAGALALAWDRTLRQAARLGSLVVTGTGNDGEEERTSGWTHLPAASPWALVATACGPIGGVRPDRPASWANSGPGLAEVMAPGGGLETDAQGMPRLRHPDDLVWSTWSRDAEPARTWQGWAGTSMAAAHASGVAALARQARADLRGSALGDWLKATAGEVALSAVPLLRADRLASGVQQPRGLPGAPESD